MTQVARTATKLLLPTGPATVRTAVARFVARFGALARRWAHRYRSRIALSRLDDHLIRDIGLDRAACGDEALRPFWR